MELLRQGCVILISVNFSDLKFCVSHDYDFLSRADGLTRLKLALLPQLPEGVTGEGGGKLTRSRPHQRGTGSAFEDQ